MRVSPPAYLNAPSLGRGKMRPPRLHRSLTSRESPPSEVEAPPPDVAILYGEGGWGREEGGVLCEEREVLIFFTNSSKGCFTVRSKERNGFFLSVTIHLHLIITGLLHF